MPDKNGQRRGGLRNPRGGIKKGDKWPATIAKELARELTRLKVTKHLEPMLEAQIAAVIGTKHLMLRNVDGTWRKATEDDDIEKALNGDPNLFYIAISPSSTQAFNTLAAYALDKPRDQIQEINLNVTELGSRLDQAREAARKRNEKKP